MKKPLISIVIATKNEEANIERILKNIFQQTLPRKNWEVIMIDNASTDKTRQLAARRIKKIYNLPDVKDVRKVRNYRGAQINYAVSKSKSPIIFFPDTDMTFDKRLFEEIVKKFQSQQVDALYLPEVVKGKGFFGKIRNFERSFYNNTSIDAVRVVSKKLFNSIGGFDEKKFKFGPDDWDFNMSVKEATNKISSTKHKVYHHEEKVTLLKYFTKKWKYSITFDEYIKKWGKNHEDIKKQFSFFYRYIGIFIEDGKWRKLIAHPLLTLGMYSLRVGVGILYLFSKFYKEK